MSVTCSLMFPALDARPVNPFKCEQCGGTYKSKMAIVQHLNRVCGKDHTHKCPHCDCKAKQKSTITAHVKNVHGETQKEAK